MIRAFRLQQCERGGADVYYLSSKQVKSVMGGGLKERLQSPRAASAAKIDTTNSKIQIILFDEIIYHDTNNAQPRLWRQLAS